MFLRSPNELLPALNFADSLKFRHWRRGRPAPGGQQRPWVMEIFRRHAWDAVRAQGVVAACWAPSEAVSLPSTGKESFAMGSHSNRSKSFCMISREVKAIPTAFVCLRFCIVIMISKQTKRQGVKRGDLAELVQECVVSGETEKAPLVNAVGGSSSKPAPQKRGRGHVLRGPPRPPPPRGRA